MTNTGSSEKLGFSDGALLSSSVAIENAPYLWRSGTVGSAAAASCQGSSPAAAASCRDASPAATASCQGITASCQFMGERRTAPAASCIVQNREPSFDPVAAAASCVQKNPASSFDSVASAASCVGADVASAASCQTVSSGPSFASLAAAASYVQF